MHVERGVVWEESIILLPASIHLVFLSATLSNANEFADWIAQLKNKPCNVVSTDMRPVPVSAVGLQTPVSLQLLLVFVALPLCVSGPRPWLISCRRREGCLPIPTPSMHSTCTNLGYQGVFREENLESAKNEMTATSAAKGARGGGFRNRKQAGAGGDLVRIVTLAQDRKWLPIITFSFRYVPTVHVTSDVHTGN